MNDYEKQRGNYYNCIALGTLTSKNFEEKLELLKLICFLTQALSKKDPTKYKNPIDVLCLLYKEEFEKEEYTGFKNYLVSLAIICEDLLYVVDDIKNPGFKNSKDIIIRIKQLIEQWLPF